MEKGTCVFCNKKEESIAMLTDRAFPIGLKCWSKAIQKGVSWANKTPLTTLRTLINRRVKG